MKMYILGISYYPPCSNINIFFSDIVNCDLKSTLRVLYNLFTRYRHVEWAHVYGDLFLNEDSQADISINYGIVL